MLQPLQLLLAAILAAGLQLGAVPRAPVHLPPSAPATSSATLAPEQTELRLAARDARRDAQAAEAAAAAQPPSIPELIDSAFAPLGPGALVWAHRVAFCESTLNPNAVNAGSGASGLFQFMPATWASSPFASASPFDPALNARAAAWLYQKYGPGQWDCQ